MSDMEKAFAMDIDDQGESADVSITIDQSSGQDACEQGDSEQENVEEHESEEDESLEDESDEYSGDDDEDETGEGNNRDAQSPKYCPICLKTTRLFTCQGCGDMAYCSRSCQRTDWPVHKYLCRQLSTFQATTRPEGQFRAILFPANDVGAEVLVGAKAPRPKFVWFGKPWNNNRFFPPDGLFEGDDYRKSIMERRQRVSTQRIRIMHPSCSLGDPRNSCIEAVVGNRYLMQPWPLAGWRGNILVVGYTGDVTMRDFRAVVDFFQCYPHNRTLVDPSRYCGRTFTGVLTLPNVHIFEPSVEPDVLEVRLTEVMVSWKRRVPLKLLDNLVPVYALTEKVDDGRKPDDPHGDAVINLNEGSLLLMISGAVKLFGKVSLPIESGPAGPVIYLREDEKPLLKHHYDALTQFVCSMVVQTADAEGLSEEQMAALDYEAEQPDIEESLTKDELRAFWARYCEKHGLEATPCPLDI